MNVYTDGQLFLKIIVDFCWYIEWKELESFLKVALQLKERDANRYLWLKYIKQPILPSNLLVTYPFRRKPFKIILSPFLLGTTINQNLKLKVII